MAAIEGLCAECYIKLDSTQVPGIENHNPVAFCTLEHKSLHLENWRKCIKSAEELEWRAEPTPTPDPLEE